MGFLPSLSKEIAQRPRHLGRGFFGEKMSTVQSQARDVVRTFPPHLQYVVRNMNETVPPPQNHNGHFTFTSMSASSCRKSMLAAAR